jgi:hypothetical protein
MKFSKRNSAFWQVANIIRDLDTVSDKIFAINTIIKDDLKDGKITQKSGAGVDMYSQGRIDAAIYWQKKLIASGDLINPLFIPPNSPIMAEG